MSTLLFVVGTRPDTIKMLPLILAFKEEATHAVVVLSSGQHHEIVRDLLARFRLEVDVELELPQKRELLGDLLGPLLPQMEVAMRQIRPQAVFVHGDTGTAMAAALAAFHAQIPVVHVEAGLRSFDRNSPFPEEVYRRLISQIAELHFVPDVNAAENLKLEGVHSGKIHLVGNTVGDAMRFLPKTERGSGDFDVLITVHRRELKQTDLIVLRDLLDSEKKLRFHFVLHPSPAKQHRVRGLFSNMENVRLSEPLAYPEFISLLRTSRGVITDSGGVQEEASLMGKPLLVFRRASERILGQGQVIGIGRESFQSFLRNLQSVPQGVPSSPMSKSVSRRIVELYRQEGIPC